MKCKGNNSLARSSLRAALNPTLPLPAECQEFWHCQTLWHLLWTPFEILHLHLYGFHSSQSNASLPPLHHSRDTRTQVPERCRCSSATYLPPALYRSVSVSIAHRVNLIRLHLPLVCMAPSTHTTHAFILGRPSAQCRAARENPTGS